jgi:hypothetical protein
LYWRTHPAQHQQMLLIQQQKWKNYQLTKSKH